MRVILLKEKSLEILEKVEVIEVIEKVEILEKVEKVGELEVEEIERVEDLEECEAIETEKEKRKGNRFAANPKECQRLDPPRETKEFRQSPKKEETNCFPRLPTVFPRDSQDLK